MLKNRDAIRDDLPVWRIPEDMVGSYGRRYFDGERYYSSNMYDDFKAIDVSGQIYRWKNFGHGNCTSFSVVGGYLYLDIAGEQEEQYQLTLERSAPLKNSWFRRLPKELIQMYQS